MNKFQWNPLLEAEGDIGAASEQAADMDQSSVVTGDEPDAGSAPVSDPVETQTDVSQQESFASRLKQEREKLEQQYQPHKQVYSQAEQIAKSLGYNDVDSYFAAVNEQLRQQQAEQEAERLGVDPETYNQYFAPVHSELNQTKQELQRLKEAEFNRSVESEVNRLASQYPDFKEHEEQVFQIASELKLPPNRLEYAYRLATYESRIAATKLETEQQVLANVTGRDQKQVLSASDRGNTPILDPATMSLSDIEKISKRVQSGDRIIL